MKLAAVSSSSQSMEEIRMKDKDGVTVDAGPRYAGPGRKGRGVGGQPGSAHSDCLFPIFPLTHSSFLLAEAEQKFNWEMDLQVVISDGKSVAGLAGHGSRKINLGSALGH